MVHVLCIHFVKPQIVARNKCMNMYKKEMYMYVKKGNAKSLSKDQATHKHFSPLYMYVCVANSPGFDKLH